jgi:hypothetical protein
MAMARTVFPGRGGPGLIELSMKRVPVGEPVAPLPPGGEALAPVSSAPASAAPPRDWQGYLDRIQSYIPAEIIAFYIFINSLVDPASAPVWRGWSHDDIAALIGLVLGLAACFLYARMAAANDRNPAWRTQGVLWAVAFLIWVYAIDAKVLEALNIELVPAFAGLLLGGFTLFSGFVIPSGVTPPDE